MPLTQQGGTPFPQIRDVLQEVLVRRVTPEPFQALLNNLDTSAQENNTKQTMSTYTDEDTSFPSMAVASSLSLSLGSCMHACHIGWGNELTWNDSIHLQLL